LDRDAVLALLIAQLRDVVPDLAEKPIVGTDSMAELGVDSIERSEILMNTLETLALDLPMVQLHGPRNLGELADLLHGKL
jgi:polyketide biosynthesis acyl carrier protein